VGSAEMAPVATPTSYKSKEVDHWSKDEVREFLHDTIPNHPCINLFQYTTGHVLATLSKEDLRRQAKDEEAANVIWAELQMFNKVIQERKTIISANPASYTIFVRTPAEVAMEFDVHPTDTVAILKSRLADMEGTPVENQRLIKNAINMQDHRTLASYNVNHGATILLVPQINSSQRFVAPPAPRGMLMVPGNKGWQPSHAAKPYMPVVCTDIYRPFPMSIEFNGVPDYKTFMLAVQKQCAPKGNPFENVGDNPASGAPILEISPGDNSHEPVQTRIMLDNDTEMLRVDTVGDIVVPNTRYNAVLHLHGEQIQVYLTTGTKIG